MAISKYKPKWPNSASVTIRFYSINGSLANMFPSFSTANRGTGIMGSSTKDRATHPRFTEGSHNWQTNSIYPHKGAHGEAIRKRSVVFIRHPERELPATIGLLLSFPAWKKFQPPWIHLSDTVTKRLLNVPTKEPPPLSLETSLQGDQLYTSCPLFLTPGNSCIGRTPPPPRSVSTFTPSPTPPE